MAHPTDSGTKVAVYTPPTAVTQTNETSAAALGARARADIEARTVVALNRPRDQADFRERILLACKRSNFAALARYSKPLGGRNKAEGFTIRFAEECVRHYRNLDLSTMVVSEDDERRVVRCSVTDLETNVPWSTEVVVPKTIERRSVQDGDEVLRKRLNSEGVAVYIKRATEDEIAISQNRLCAKAMRNLVLNHIPSDVLEEAEGHIFDTLKADDEKDPTAVRKQVQDLFYRLGVSAKDLAEFLDHSVESMSPAELHVLRQIYNGMKSEGTTWREVMELKRGGKTPDASKPSGPGGGGIDGALAKAEAKAPPKAEPKAEAKVAEEPQGPAPVPPSILAVLEYKQANPTKRVDPERAEDLRLYLLDHPERVPALAAQFPAAFPAAPTSAS